MSLEFPDLLGVQGVDLWWMKRERLERGYSRPHTPHVNTSIHTTPEHIVCHKEITKDDLVDGEEHIKDFPEVEENVKR